jgi:MFS family permease
VPRFERTRRRILRWSPVFGAFAVGAIAYGGLYCFPPISVAFAREFGASRTLTVTPWTMFLLVSALSSPLLGRAYDIVLDRQLLATGLLVMAAGWFVATLATDVSLLVVAYGMLLSIGLGLVFVGTTTAIARRYAGRSGLALGIAYAGPAAGVALALPIVTPAIDDLGWRAVMDGFVVLSVAGLPFVWLMTSGPAIVVPAQPAPPQPRAAVRTPPQPAGLHETSAPGAIGASQEIPPVGRGLRPATLRRALRTRRFWILFCGAVAIGVIDEGVFQTFLPHAATRGIDEDLAAQALGLQALAYVVGQVAGGALSDRFGRRGIGLLAMAVVVAGTTAAFTATGAEPLVAVAGIVGHGFGIGATIAVRSAAFSDVFGGPNFGAIFGVLAIAYPVGGMLPLYVGGISFDRLGSYWPVYALAMVAVAVWSVSLWVAGPRRHGRSLQLSRPRRQAA